MAGTKKAADTYEGFTKEERAAMKERAKEMKAAAKQADGEADIRAKLAELSPEDRAMGERIHAIVTAAAPHLEPRTWYGQPAYAKDGKVLCFYQPASKFKTRYGTLGFSDVAALDDGAMWPSAYALAELTPEVEARIAELVAKAAG